MQAVASGARAGDEQQRGWNPTGLMDAAAYISVGVGYLVAVLSASHLTLLGFTLQTAGNLLWIWLFRRLSCGTISERERLWLTLAMVGTATAILQLVWLDAGFNWLLPLVSVSVIALSYPVKRAVLFGGVMWLATIWTLLALDSGRYLVNDLILLLPGFIFTFVFSLVLRYQFELRERAEALVAELEAAQEQLRAHAHAAEELAVSRERNRMAREIHDTLGHYLTLLAVQLETALKLEERGDVRLHEELVESRRVAAECLTEVRRSVAALRPADPTARSFNDALTRLVAEFEAVLPETEIALDVEGPAQSLAPELRMALYRCAQESLTNIRKHAHASKVLVRLRVDDQCAELTVLDNGTGGAVADEAQEPGFGILGMRERIALLGGTATARPELGRGWRVEVRVPLPASVSTAVVMSEHAPLEGALSVVAVSGEGS